MTAIPCPACGEVNTHHDDMGGTATAKDGDVGLCYYCGGIAIFTVDAAGRLGQRVPTPDEYREVNADPRIQVARRAITESATPPEAVARMRKAAS